MEKRGVTESDVEYLLETNAYMSAEESEDEVASDADGILMEGRMMIVKFPLYRSPKVISHRERKEVVFLIYSYYLVAKHDRLT